MNELTKEKQITVFYPELGKNIDCYHTKVVRLAVEELKRQMTDKIEINTADDQVIINMIFLIIDDVFSGVKE